MSGDQLDLDAIEARAGQVTRLGANFDALMVRKMAAEDVPALVAEVRRLRAAEAGIVEAWPALVAEVRRLRAKVERVEAAVSDNGPRTMMLADDVRAALDGA